MKQNKKPSLLILAAGLGSRYGGLKQLDPVGPHGETIIDYSIYDAIQAGFGKVVSVIRRSFKDEYKAKITGKFERKIEFREVYQATKLDREDIELSDRVKPWGTGHAVLCARDEISEPFAVINADDFYGRQAMVELSNFLQRQAGPENFAMVGFILKNTLSPHGPVSRGVCSVSADSKLRGVMEHEDIRAGGHGKIQAKYQGEERVLDPEVLVSMNMWGLHPDFFNYLSGRFERFLQRHSEDPKAEFYLPLAVNELVEAGKVDVRVLPSEERWYGVTYQEDAKEVEAALRGKVEAGIYPSPIWMGL